MVVLRVRDEKNKEWYEIGGASLNWIDIINKPDLDDISDGTNYGRIAWSALQEGKALLSEVVGTLDDIVDGTYGKVLLTDISAGHILLASCEGDLDDVDDGENWGKVAVTSISAGKILLAETEGDLDDIINGTSYGKVAITDIQAGHILLATCDGDLDDIANGTSYGKVALTGISAGKIIVAGLDSGVTVKMFTDGITKENIEAWRKAEDVTMIDGGKIYAKSITADEIMVGTITADEIKIGGISIDRLETGLIEDFEGLNLGNIHGQPAGGYERWGAWVVDADASTSANIVSGKHLYLLDNSVVGHVEAELSAISGNELITGVIEWEMRNSANNKNSYASVRKGTVFSFAVWFKDDGNIEYQCSGGVSQTLQAYAANTWYKIRVHFDCISGYCCIFIDDTFNSRQALATGAVGNYIDRIQFYTGDADAIGFGINNLKIYNVTV